MLCVYYTRVWHVGKLCVVHVPARTAQASGRPEPSQGPDHITRGPRGGPASQMSVTRSVRGELEPYSVHVPEHTPSCRRPFTCARLWLCCCCCLHDSLSPDWPPPQLIPTYFILGVVGGGAARRPPPVSHVLSTGWPPRQAGRTWGNGGEAIA